MTVERQATLANGLLVMASVLLAAIPATRPIGLCCTAFMGSGLIFSGITRYCGWVRILPVLSQKWRPGKR
ncbi:MAG: YgaP-like transmembrane domain [Planctomycetaceae bacterium]